MRRAEHLFVDDKAGKPTAIHQMIGRRPIACFGNSDGDQAMLQYTTIGNPRPSFGSIASITPTPNVNSPTTRNQGAPECWSTALIEVAQGR